MTERETAPAPGQQQPVPLSHAERLERAKRVAKLAARCEQTLADLIYHMPGHHSYVRDAIKIGLAVEDIREIGAEAQAEIGELGDCAHG